MPAFLEIYGDLQSDGTYVLSSATNSLLTSILSAGTFCGALFGSTIGDSIGRRYGIVAYVGKSSPLSEPHELMSHQSFSPSGSRYRPGATMSLALPWVAF